MERFSISQMKGMTELMLLNVQVSFAHPQLLRTVSMTVDAALLVYQYYFIHFSLEIR